MQLPSTQARKTKNKFLYFLIFRKMKLSCPNIKQFVILQEIEIPEIYFIV